MKLPKRNVFHIFFIAAIIILLLPYSFRSLKDNTTLPGGESYYHARMAQQIIEKGIPKEDSFAFNGRPYFFNPFHFLLALFACVFGIVNASKITPLVLGLLSVYLLYLILKKLKLKQLPLYSILGAFILSPIFSYAFSISSDWCLIILLNLLGLYTFMQDKKYYTALAVCCFGINSLFGIMHALLSAAIVFFYSFYNKKKIKKAYLILASLIIIILAYNIPIYLQLESFNFVQKNLVTDFISDLGGIAGFSVFILLLALLGLIFVWKYKTKYYSLYAFSLFLIAYSFFNKSAAVYSNFILVFLAGIAFASFAEMKWRLKPIRDFTLIVLFCGLLFSTISHAVMLSELQPNDDLKDALLWLEHRSNPHEKVFSHYSKGFWIEFWADRPVVMDSLFETALNANTLFIDSEEIFASNDIRITQKLLSKYDIDYILITKDMTQGLVWEKQGQGLNFLLSNNETFKKRYTNPYCEIYEYIYQEK